MVKNTPLINSMKQLANFQNRFLWKCNKQTVLRYNANGANEKVKTVACFAEESSACK